MEATLDTTNIGQFPTDDYPVETIGRLVQWRIEYCGSSSKHKSHLFTMRIWEWFLAVEKSDDDMVIYLKPVHARLVGQQSPLVQFVFRVYKKEVTGRRSCISPAYELVFQKERICDWKVNSIFNGSYTVQVEFQDLKIASINGGDPSPIWPYEGVLEHLSARFGVGCLSRMLTESIHTDLTISNLDGTLEAHKAVLSSASSVFKSMFYFQSRENKMSNITMPDISLGCLSALLQYIYGNIECDEFWDHRMELLAAADKYDIMELKNFCEKCLIEDINSENVLNRLKEALWLRTDKLKNACITFLFDFGKAHDLKNEIDSLIQEGDREMWVVLYNAIQH